MIRELREENKRLRDLLANQETKTETIVVTQEDHAQAEADRAQLRALEAKLAEMTMSWDERLAQEKEKGASESTLNEGADLSLPHVTNLNEDPQLTGKLIFSFP